MFNCKRKKIGVIKKDPVFCAYILTGSSTPKAKGVLDSGTGRIKCIRMNTMSLFESGDSSGVISIRDMLSENFSSKILENTSIEKVAYLLIRGGWPGAINIEPKVSNQIAMNYMKNVLKSDLKEFDDTLELNEHKAKLILKSLA